CLGASPYGASTPGCAGAELLNVSAIPTVGNASFAFHSTNAPPSSIGLLFVGDVPNVAGAGYLGLGVQFHVDLFASAQLLGLNASSDAKGFGVAPAPIPNNPALHGASVYAQEVWLWPAAVCPLPPFGLSATNALKVTFP
ncbi:MAG TPA: hypothetical protein VKE69_05790, partial [Planctomycetota bacterium]|nr:hypothetical protein [Planctomycetota bacterium]